MVGADEIKQLRGRKASNVLADGVNRVGDAASLEFLVVDLAIGLAGQRQTQHLQPRFRRRQHQARFERGLRRGNKKQAREPEFLPRRLRHEQMAEVNRIERPAE